VVSLLITLIVLVAIVAIVMWVLQSIALPPPVRILVIAVCAIVCILILVSMLPGGPGHWPAWR
jgi:hypothetical protein